MGEAILDIISSTSIVLGIFGRNSTGKCFFKDGPLASSLLQMLYNSVFSTAAILYCLIISIVVVYKVKNEKHDQSLESLTNHRTSEDRSSLLSLRSLICCTCLYPTSCFLAYVGLNVVGIYKYIFHDYPKFLLYWSRFGSSSRGILHIIAFIADPLIYKAIPKLLITNSNAKLESELDEIEDPEDWDCSYEYLFGPSHSNNLTPSLRKMIRDFQRYI
ncbi:hypothetical protein DSO57_1003712 [Entomophthora muscae]|uniref:Uncharacterized protein n=1 Tax=Entomophthora muscae TaxID=34485 RepID=A0ACC2SXC9_9FUNG|nr:hypothetical protein DSO57_1003712 [Entomophthora muscae]